MENMFKLSPKEMKGEIWDEKGSYESGSELVEILISHQQDVINSIRFTYRTSRRVFHSQTYGEPNGLNFDMVEFKHREEVLTSVSGELLDGRLASIVFGTNKKTYGPFGRTSSKSKITSNGGHMGAPTPTSSVSLSVLCATEHHPLFLSLPTQSQNTTFSPSDNLCILSSDSLSGSNPLPLSTIPPPRHSGSYDAFKYEFKPGRFGGFHGCVYDGSVYAIGVYVKPYQVYTMDEYLDDIIADCYDDDSC